VAAPDPEIVPLPQARNDRILPPSIHPSVSGSFAVESDHRDVVAIDIPLEGESGYALRK
jgi:hypothetical protein